MHEGKERERGGRGLLDGWVNCWDNREVDGDVTRFQTTEWLVALQHITRLGEQEYHNHMTSLHPLL